MEAIKCKQCSASMPWDGVATRIECPFCGTVYEKKIQNVREPKKRYLSREGEEFLVGYYPPNFDGQYLIRSFGNEPNISCIEKPVKVFYEMTSSDGEAHILFITGTVYHHIEDNAVNVQRQDTCGIDLKRYRSYVGAEKYADIRFAEEHPAAENVQILYNEKPCEKSAQSLRKMRQMYQSQGMGGSYDNGFSGKMYSYSEHGADQLCLVRLALECVEMPALNNPLGKMLGGMLGGLGGLAQAKPLRNITWAVFNEIYFWGTPGGVKKYWDEFEKVYETIMVGPAYSQMEAQIHNLFYQTQQVINRNQMSMMNAQMASSQRMGQMINDTYSYGMELDRQTWANTNATMDHVNEMRSEALRGVNSYSTYDGRTVEADVRFDHVYQNNNYSDVFTASDNPLDPLMDWTEIKKR